MVCAFLFFVIGLIGMTFIIVDSTIATGFRKWWRDHMKYKLFGHDIAEIVDCHQCAGFWVGLLGFPYLMPWIPNPYIHWLYGLVAMPVTFILSGCAISVLSWLTRAIIDRLTMSVSFNIEEVDGDYEDDCEEDETKPLGD